MRKAEIHLAECTPLAVEKSLDMTECRSRGRWVREGASEVLLIYSNCSEVLKELITINNETMADIYVLW